MLLTALNRKLLRDLGNMRGQALAIALIAATGVVTYVALLSVYESLRDMSDGLSEREKLQFECHL